MKSHTAFNLGKNPPVQHCCRASTWSISKVVTEDPILLVALTSFMNTKPNLLQGILFAWLNVATTNVCIEKESGNSCIPHLCHINLLAWGHFQPLSEDCPGIQTCQTKSTPWSHKRHASRSAWLCTLQISYGSNHANPIDIQSMPYCEDQPGKIWWWCAHVLW